MYLVHGFFKLLKTPVTCITNAIDHCKFIRLSLNREIDIVVKLEECDDTYFCIRPGLSVKFLVFLAVNALFHLFPPKLKCGEQVMVERIA